MAGFSSKILNNANSALAATQALIATTGNNIANVNTPGYSRRIVNLETRQTNGTSSQVNVGSGVTVQSVRRAADKFIQNLLQDAISEKGDTAIGTEFMDRIQNFFSLDPEKNSIGGALTSFFTAMNDLTTDPANVDLRANVLQKAQEVIDTIKTTYNGLASLQGEADSRIVADVDVVNSLTQQIADLNVKITGREIGNTEASDERDQRDELLKKLADKISFDQVEQADGSVLVTLSNGFALVNGGQARQLETTVSPSFAGGPLPNSLNGGILSYIVYDAGGGSQIDLTQTLKNGGGSIGGLLDVRGYNAPSNTSPFEADGIIVEMASRVESITRALLVNFNSEYFGPDQDTTVAGYTPSARDYNGNPPDITQYFGLFDFNFAGTKDSNANGQPDAADLTASGLQNFSSVLQLGVTDPLELAAGRVDVDVAPPASFPQGDGRNAEALAQLQFDNTLVFGAGSFSLTGSFSTLYNESVTHVGNAKSAADVADSVAQSNLTTTQNQRDEISGVSLDEEFSNLIRFQKTFQASARMIKVADDLLSQIVSLI